MEVLTLANELIKTTEPVTISMPVWLIELIDAHATKTDLSRSAIITRAVRRYLLVQNDEPTLWKEMYDAAKRKQ